MANLFLNNSFEGFWNHPNDIPELQIPEHWLFDWTTDGEFVRPEVRVLPSAYLPEDERGVFILDGNQCIKIHSPGDPAFPWCGELSQDVWLISGLWRALFRVYNDAIKGYDGEGNKEGALLGACNVYGIAACLIPGIHPQSAHDHIGDEHSLPSLKYSVVPFEFTITATGEYNVGLTIEMPKHHENNGVFLDAWELERIGDVPQPELEPLEPYHRTVDLLPQNVSWANYKEVARQIWQRKGEMTQSARPAFMRPPDIASLTVNMWDADQWGPRDEFEAWVEKHYPPLPAIHYKEFQTPEPTPSPDPGPQYVKPAELLTVHLQESIRDWLNFLRRVRPEWFKLVFGFERAIEVAAVSPFTNVLIRYVDDNAGFYIGTQAHGYNDALPPKDAANILLNKFWPDGEMPSWVKYVTAVEGLNETIGTGETKKTRNAVAFAVAFSEAVAARKTFVRACILNVAVGNPGHDEVELLLPAVEAAVRNGHYIGYHPYFPASPGKTREWLETEGKHHHMRALWSWDTVFNKHGLYPLYLFNECGAIGTTVRADGRPGGYITSGHGWRHPETLNGDWPEYLACLLQWNEMVKAWNADNGNRVRGSTIFTVGGGTRWTNFELRQPELDALAEALGG